MRCVPRALRTVYTVLVCVLVPVYVWRYGFGTFLWFSNIALLTTLAAIWLRNRLLLSMMALAVFLPEIGWNLAFWARLLFGVDLFGLLDYMFAEQVELWARVLSLYHVPLPVVLLWLVWRCGYDPRALTWQTLVAWIVLTVSFAVSRPQHNINLVYGLLDEMRRPVIQPPLPFLLLITGVPLVVYWPTHVLFKRCFTRASLPPTGSEGRIP